MSSRDGRDPLSKTLIALVKACHGAATLAVTSIALLLGLSAGLGGWWLALVGTTVLVGQLSIGWSNDWWDVERDVAAGRLDKPAAQGDISAAALRTAAVASAVAAVPLSVAAGWVGLWHLVLVGAGWAYNLVLKPTAWSAVPYFVGFASLPLYVVGVSGGVAPWWMALAGGLLGVAAHMANAAPDIDDDRAAGVLGFPQRLGARPSVVTALVILAGVAVLLIGQLDLTGWSRLLAAAAVTAPLIACSALVVAGRMGRSIFVLVASAAVVDVALLAAAA